MTQIDSIQLVVATSTEMEIALKNYLLSLKAKRRSQSTQEKYGYHLERLRCWLLERGIDHPKQLKRVLLYEWIAELYECWATATVRQAIAAVRDFVRWCREMGWIKKKQKKKLFKALNLAKVEKRVQRTLSIDEFEALLAACDLTTAKGVRDAAIVSLLLDSGLRASEICHLKLDNVEFGLKLLPGVVLNRVIVIVKGNKRLYGYFGQFAAQYLAAWSEIRSTVAAPTAPELFVSIGGTKRGHGLSQDGLRVILRKLGEKAGIKGVSPHSFRRAFACIMEMAGASTRTIQELGRWNELDMVLLYTQDYKAAMAYNRYSPMDYINRLEQ